MPVETRDLMIAFVGTFIARQRIMEEIDKLERQQGRAH